MGFIEIFLIAVGLAMDAFAVSLVAGTLKNVRRPRATFRLAFHFGLFQFFMPLIGWYAGVKIVGGLILIVIGLRILSSHLWA